MNLESPSRRHPYPSVFLHLRISEYVSAKVIRAGIIGPIAVGIIFGEPLANILHVHWEETFLYLGYIGLILIIFEVPRPGVLCPIGASYLLLYLGYGYGAVETFIIGAALSATSLGTTFAVIASASKSVDLSQTPVGAVLVSAAVIDDVTGLVMSSVIHDLGKISSGVFMKWFFDPLFRRFRAPLRQVRPLIQHYARDCRTIRIHFDCCYVLAPLFFASIGFAIPFLDLWTGQAIWKGILYTLLTLFCKFVVGIWIPTWSVIQPDPKKAKANLQQQSLGKNGRPLEVIASALHSPSRSAAFISSAYPALLLGMAMVARGEIGLLIVEVGYNKTSYVSSEGFITAIWAIVLNTIIGSIFVGALIKYQGDAIGKGPWGLVRGPDHTIELEMERSEERQETEMEAETMERMGNHYGIV
ncbi:hypothetical protein B0J11DRAFT_512173 [Dendryphion nanum]|uniref:Cation/H+ exchanger transmembrane domain-containing protein n=1 Tax=Dendryphion nanum TaxID=256645 RepID=A0A9P9D2A7_9PLEO|nr:hypothetical protein B0J11DRAFT_512173 [Dendryphion nanum]